MSVAARVRGWLRREQACMGSDIEEPSSQLMPSPSVGCSRVEAGRGLREVYERSTRGVLEGRQAFFPGVAAIHRRHLVKEADGRESARGWLVF